LEETIDAKLREITHILSKTMKKCWYTLDVQGCILRGMRGMSCIWGMCV